MFEGKNVKSMKNVCEWLREKENYIKNGKRGSRRDKIEDL